MGEQIEKSEEKKEELATNIAAQVEELPNLRTTKFEELKISEDINSSNLKSALNTIKDYHNILVSVQQILIEAFNRDETNEPVEFIINDTPSNDKALQAEKERIKKEEEEKAKLEKKKKEEEEEMQRKEKERLEKEKKEAELKSQKQKEEEERLKQKAEEQAKKAEEESRKLKEAEERLIKAKEEQAKIKAEEKQKKGKKDKE